MVLELAIELSVFYFVASCEAIILELNFISFLKLIAERHGPSTSKVP